MTGINREYRDRLPDEAATISLASRLALAAPPAGCVFLAGELGAGKTTFARGFLRALGVRGAIRSPTYTLVEPYDTAGSHVLHMDLYRLADPEEVEYLGVREEINQSILLVEWAEKGRGFLPEPDLVVHLAIADAGRDINIAANTQRGCSWLVSAID